jgi:hypothetical protein
MEGLNQFYAEPANAPVPIMFALDCIRLKATGTSREERLMRARAVASEALREKKTKSDLSRCTFIGDPADTRQRRKFAIWRASGPGGLCRSSPLPGGPVGDFLPGLER